MAINQYLDTLDTTGALSRQGGAFPTGLTRRTSTDGYFIGAQPDPFLGGLSPIQFGTVAMERFYAKDILAQTTQVGNFKQLVGGHLGMSIVVPRVPEIKVRKLKVGRPRPLETSTAKPLTLEIKYGTEWGHFQPEIDQYFSQVKSYVQQISKGAVEKNAAVIDRHCFSLLPDFAPSYNVGNSAGKAGGNYTLGTVTSPAIITRDNIEDYLGQFLHVVMETEIGMESGQFTVVIPTKMAYLLRTSTYMKDASVRGTKSSLATRKLPTIFDYDIYSSNLLTHMTGYSDVFPVYAYTKEALAFAMAINKVNTKEPDRVDGIEVYGQTIYGFDCEREDGVAVGYVKFSDTAIDTGSGTSTDDDFRTQYDFDSKGETYVNVRPVSNPTGNPKANGWYKWDATADSNNGNYVLATETSVDDQTTYYEEVNS